MCCGPVGARAARGWRARAASFHLLPLSQEQARAAGTLSLLLACPVSWAAPAPPPPSGSCCWVPVVVGPVGVRSSAACRVSVAPTGCVLRGLRVPFRLCLMGCVAPVGCVPGACSDPVTWASICSGLVLGFGTGLASVLVWCWGSGLSVLALGSDSCVSSPASAADRVPWGWNPCLHQTQLLSAPAAEPSPGARFSSRRTR